MACALDRCAIKLSEDWCGDAGRRAAASVPEAIGYRPNWRIALDEIDRVLPAGARFGCVLADAEYGKAAEFRAGLAKRRLAFTVGIVADPALLPDPGLVHEPELNPLRLGMVRRCLVHQAGQGFLNCC